MKILRYSFLSIIFLIAAPYVTAQAEKNSDPSKLMATMFRKKTSEWQEVFNSGNAKNLAQFYAEDARYISSDIPGLSLNGRGEIITYLQGMINKGNKMDSITIRSLDISEDLATVYCDFNMTRDKVTSKGQNIMILRKTGLKWQIFLHMVVE